MSTNAMTVLYLFFDLLFPILSGPGAALLYVQVMQSSQPRWRPVFWLGYLGWQGIVLVLMVYTLGDLSIGPGLLTCWLTPITAVLSFIILWRAEDDVRQATGGSVAARRSYQLGLFLIPALQIATVFAAILLGPILCEFGLRFCERL